MLSKKNSAHHPLGWILSVLLSIPMGLILLIMLTGGKAPSETSELVAYVSVWTMDIILFFCMLKTGKTDKFRAILFIIFAITLSVTFISRMIEARGSMSFNDADLMQCDVPFCHIVSTMVIIPAVLSDSIIFPGQIDSGFANISSMLIIVGTAVLVLGRGFCSWGCFYGGWDDAFSRLKKKATWKNPPTYLRWGAFAMLLLVAISSAAMLGPTYCDWLCPFKTVTEYEEVVDVESALKAVVFLSLFLGLVIILPILTKKRTQCAWFCPMGALCSSGGKAVSPYRIQVDTESCVNCGKCIQVCPMGALDEESLEKGIANMNCSLCGKCIDNCPTRSISYRIRFTRKIKNPTLSRLLFVYSGFLFLCIFSGGSIQQFIILILNLITQKGA
jgi:polyferredoxin